MKIVQPIKDLETIEELKKLLSPRDSFMFTLGINVGLKISDILDLKVKDVRDKESVTVIEKKSGKEKTYPIDRTLQEVIHNYTEEMDPESWLFPSRKGDKPISRVQAHRILSEAGDQLGVDISTTSMRKTFGYHYFQRTGDIKKLQELFNQSAPSTTRKYLNL